MRLGRVLPDERDNHAVQVEEEHDKVEAKLEEGLLLMNVKLAEDLGRIKQVSVVDDLLGIPGDQRQVEDER
jgi:hypothetical protein